MSAAGLGHNNPPSAIEELKTRLMMTHEAMRGALYAMARDVPIPDKIGSDQEAAELATDIAEMRDAAAEVEKLRRTEKKPHDDAGKAISAYFADIVAPVAARVMSGTDRIREYQKAKVYAAKKTAAVWDDRPPATKDAARVVAAGGVSISASSKWRYEVADAALVPRSLLGVNDAAVKAHIAMLRAAGMPMQIPGLKLIEDIQTVIR